LATSAETGIDINVCHLQAHASCILSHKFEHVSSRFGLDGCLDASSWDSFFSQLKHDPNTSLYFNMGRLGPRPAVHQYTHTPNWEQIFSTIEQ
jgi:hypothetical protein